MKLRYETTSGGTNHVQIVEYEKDLVFNDQDIARVFIRRDVFNESDVEKGVSKMWLVETEGTSTTNAEFGGVLRDINRNGGVSEIIVESFERYSIDAQPTDSAERWENVNDTQIINDALSNISQISAGTIENVDSEISMLFNHSTQAKKIRDTAEVVGANVVYNSDQTLDYVNRRGSDRTGETLSPSSQNIVDDFKADKKGGGERVSHVRVIGTGEGKHQLTAEATASWFDGSQRESWRVFSNKDISDQDSLDKYAQTLIQDLNEPEHIEVTTTLRNIDVQLGDSFHVQYPEEDVDRDMRIVELTEKVKPNGKTYEVTLSTRQISRKDRDAENRKDVNRYNMAFEGSPVTMNTSGGRQPVEPRRNYEFSVYYPDEVSYEHRVKLRVIGLPYRAYISQTETGGGIHSHTFDDTASETDDARAVHRHDVSPGALETFNGETYYPRNCDVIVNGQSILGVDNLLTEEWEIGVDNVGTAEGNTGPYSRHDDSPRFTAEASGDGSEASWVKSDPVDLTDQSEIGAVWSYERIVYGGNESLGDDAQLIISAATSKGVTHDDESVVAKVEELGRDATNNSTILDVSSLSGDYYISLHAVGGWGTYENNDTNEEEILGLRAKFDARGVLYDVGEGIGSGGSRFTDVVDLQGYLNPGQYNKIEITSQTLGNIQAHLDIDVYRQILGNG